MGELLIQHYGTLENYPLIGPFYIHEKAPREQPLHNNQKHVSRPKYFNKNKDAPKNTGPPEDKIYRPRPKVDSVHIDDPYDHIKHMYNNHEETHLIDTQNM